MQRYRQKVLSRIEKYDPAELFDRVRYYNSVSNDFSLDSDGERLRDYRYRGKSAYYFDLNRFVKCYPADYRVAYLFGDVVTVPEVPTLVKSRPIGDHNANSVLFKLNQNRHFVFVDDQIPYEEKRDCAVFRGAAYREPRKSFVRRLYDSDVCDVGQTNSPPEQEPWQKPFLSRSEQLKYKIIFSIEGNDVATNLKWVMSSNSLCLMPKPRFETWFMEGRLVAGHHYVQIESDLSDAEEKVRFYSKHPEAAKQIVRNANEYVRQFRNKEREDLISFLVLEKYFQQSGQQNSDWLGEQAEQAKQIAYSNAG